MVAAPGAAAAITAAATAFDATAPVARSACVSTTVTTLPNRRPTRRSPTGGSSNRAAAPGMWVTDSVAALSALEDTDSALTAGRDTSPMATSPVVIAVRTDDAVERHRSELAGSPRPRADRPAPSRCRPVGIWCWPCRTRAPTGPPATRCNRWLLPAGEPTNRRPDARSRRRRPNWPHSAAGGPTTQPATTQDALTQLAAGPAVSRRSRSSPSDLATFSRNAWPDRDHPVRPDRR